MFNLVKNLESIFSALLAIAENSELKIVLPLHPRTKGKLKEQLNAELLESIENSEFIQIIPPAGFLDIIALEKNARMIITDSGGLQKESFFFEKPCVILRPQTEWVEIVENGNAILADANYDRIIDAFNALIIKDDYSYPNYYGDGRAAEFICQTIVDQL